MNRIEYFQSLATAARAQGNHWQARQYEKEVERLTLADGPPMRLAFRLRHRAHRERLRSNGVPAGGISGLATNYACHDCGHPQQIARWAKEMHTASRWRTMWPDSAAEMIRRARAIRMGAA
jgi:hypothetical protein